MRASFNDLISPTKRTIYVLFLPLLLLQMFYVPLTTKGKFYEVAVNTNPNNNAQNHHQRNNASAGQTPPGFDAARKSDYVYRISDLVLNNSSLPLNLKLIYAPSFVDVPGK